MEEKKNTAEQTTPPEGEQMERGVENPDIIDLIRLGPGKDEVELVVLERRPWNGGRKQLEQFDEKLNRYLTYILNGFVGRHYPDYEGLPTRLVIDCVEPPGGQDVLRFFAGVESVCEANDIAFSIRAGETE